MKTFIVKRGYDNPLKVTLSDAGLFRTKASEESAENFNVVFFDRPEQSGTLVIPNSGEDLPGVASIAGVTMIYLEGTSIEEETYDYEEKVRESTPMPAPVRKWEQI